MRRLDLSRTEWRIERCMENVLVWEFLVLLYGVRITYSQLIYFRACEFGD